MGGTDKKKLYALLSPLILVATQILHFALKLVFKMQMFKLCITFFSSVSFEPLFPVVLFFLRRSSVETLRPWWWKSQAELFTLECRGLCRKRRTS